MCSVPSSMSLSKSIGFGAPMVLMSTTLLHVVPCCANDLDKDGKKVKNELLEFNENAIQKVIEDPKSTLKECDVDQIAFFFQTPYANSEINIRSMLESKWKTSKDPSDFLENLYCTVHGSRKHGGDYSHRFMKFSQWCKDCGIDRQAWETRINGRLHPALKCPDNPHTNMVKELLQYSDEPTLSSIHRTFADTDDDAEELEIIKDLHTQMHKVHEEFEKDLYPNERIQAQNLVISAGVMLVTSNKLPGQIPFYKDLTKADQDLNESIREIVRFSATDLINYDEILQDLRKHADDAQSRRDILTKAAKKMKKLRKRVAMMRFVYRIDNTSAVSS